MVTMQPEPAGRISAPSACFPLRRYHTCHTLSVQAASSMPTHNYKSCVELGCQDITIGLAIHHWVCQQGSCCYYEQRCFQSLGRVKGLRAGLTSNANPSDPFKPAINENPCGCRCGHILTCTTIWQASAVYATAYRMARHQLSQ
jgi:hypothetical protein